MIRHLRIEGWRAFEHLSLELTDGVTFIVAQNGIGKTSLIDAARWGLFGDRSGVKADTSRRFGEADVRVAVDLELPNSSVLQIERTLTGKTATVSATLEGRRVDEAELPALFAAQFGATLEFLSRTTVLPSDAVTDSASSVSELHQHLCHVYGVDDLQASAKALTQVQRDAESIAKTFRAQARRSGADLSQLNAGLNEVKGRMTEAEAAREVSREELTSAFEQLHQARAARDELLRHDAQRRAAQRLWADSDDLLAGLSTARHLNFAPRPDAGKHSASAMLGWLHIVETSTVSWADSLRQRLAAVSGQREATTASLDSLHSADAECPVCQRELGQTDVTAAEHAHQSTLVTLSQHADQLAGELTTATLLITRTRELIQEAAGITQHSGSPPQASPVDLASASDVEESGDSAVIAAAQDAVDAASVRNDAATDRLADVRSEHRQLQQRITAEQDAIDQEQLSLQAHRREAAASIASAIVTQTAQTLLAERIEPLATEIMHRWKRVFVDRGELRLRDNGHLVLVRGTHEIPFQQLSAGEKVIGLLATRLLVLAASTKASFLWLDEPLEHLDPANRRLAASLMTGAGTNVRQLLVTTYEENLARRLADAPNVSLRYIRTST